MAADGEAAKNTTDDMEVQITQAMKNKVKDFKEQADSLTLEGVRRSLEKDLGLKTYSLDAHKRFIKKCLEKHFYGADDENGPTSLEVHASQSVKEHKSVDDQPPIDIGTSKADIDKEQEVSPSSAGKEPACTVTEESKLSERETDLSEDTIKEALKERAAYLRANLEHITLAKLRRMLEKDLKIKEKALDAYKSFIAEEVDLILQSSEAFDSGNGVKKTKKPIQNLERSKPVKKSKGSHKESDSSDNNDAEDDIDEKKISKKRAAPKSKATETCLKRQKKSTNETSDPKVKKLVEQESEKSSADEAGNSFGDDHSHSSQEVKKKPEKPAQVYSKKVENLKSVIKSCGMGVPPSVYRRAKQAPESEREAFLVKELKEILEKEGLSNNPSEKEIRSVRKRKERAKELEGIDMSNIVTTSRRGSTYSYIPPPKPKIELESDEDEEEEDEKDDDDDEDNEENSDDGDNNDVESNEGSEEGVEDESD